MPPHIEFLFVKRERVKKKLDEMVKMNKLVKAEEPTDWCSDMTVVVEFQRRIHEALDGLPGVFSIADYISIYGLGNSPEEAEMCHDKHLHLFMQRVIERNLKLNPTKVQFVRYLELFLIY